MNNETSDRLAEGDERRGHHGGGSCEQSPLQTRAAFLENRSWDSVVRFNQGACARGGAQHGENSESYEATRIVWETEQTTVRPLIETLEFLRSCHRRAPFLFFNGNTFADIGRNLTDFLFADLPRIRRREVASAAAHYIAGVLDRDAMVNIVDSLSRAADLKPGDRVQTLRGSLRGTITRILEDGRIGWRPDGSTSDLLALPESLKEER